MIIRRHIIYCLRRDLEKAINLLMRWGETVESSLFADDHAVEASNHRRFGAFQRMFCVCVLYVLIILAPAGLIWIRH